MTFLSFLLPSSFFLLYLLTLSPDVLPADAAEFQVVVPLLGVAHPPGFVLYTLLGKLFTLALFFLSPARALNLFSALTGALTLAVVAATVNRFAARGAGHGETPAPTRLPGVLAAAALGVSTTFWSQSTTANVRSLSGLFAALCLWSLVKEGGSRKKEENAPGASSPLPRRTPAPLLFFLFLSFGITHHASLVFMGVVFVAYFLLCDRNYARPRRWIGPLALSLLPLLLLLYLPIRGAMGAFLAPPHLNTLSGFLEHVLARGFEGDFFYFAHLSALPDRLAILGNILAFQFNPLLLALFALAVPFAFRRDWRYSLMLLAAFAIHAFVAITYRAPQTVEYLLPAYVVMGVTVGLGTEYVIRNTGRVVRIACFVLLALSVVTLFLRNLPSFIALSRDRFTREYAEAVLTDAPANSVVLSSWHWAAPMWYLHKVEAARPDVDVVYVFPEDDSLADTWVRHIRESIGTRPVVVTSFYPAEYAATGYRFLPLGDSWEVREGPLMGLPDGFLSASTPFGNRWQLAGFRLEMDSALPNETVPVTLAWQTNGAPEDIHFFAQLIGPDGALYAQADFDHLAASYVTGEVLLDRALLTLRPDSPPGDYALIAGAVGADGKRLMQNGSDYIPLGFVPVALAQTSPATRHPSLRRVGAVTLLGYDFDNTLPDTVRLYLHWRLAAVPQSVVVYGRALAAHQVTLPAGPGYLTTAIDLPWGMEVYITADKEPRGGTSIRQRSPSDRYLPLGGSLILTGVRINETSPGEYVVDLDWLSARPLTEDDIISVSLVGNGWRTQSDGVPAGGAIPTLKWIRGSRIHDRHRLTAPPGATSPARFELVVYDHFTQRNLPILNPDVARLGPTVPLGEVMLP